MAGDRTDPADPRDEGLVANNRTRWVIVGLSKGVVPGYVMATLSGLDEYQKQVRNVEVETKHLPITVPLPAAERYCIGDTLTITTEPLGAAS